jgi:purine-binding chemotaxis protein CheW
MSNLPELTRTSTRLRAGAPPPPRERDIFTVIAAGERLGLPVECVHTIFRISRITPVPRGPREVIGLANLRGKIVTVASLRRRLGLEDRGAHAASLAIGIEHLGESIALMVDEVGDVMTVSEADRILAPPHLTSARLGVTSSVYRLDEGILSVLDLTALFDFGRADARAKANFRSAD